SYALSASIAHRTLNAKHNLATDILMYPSIQTQYKGVNMAITPNFVDNMMRVQRFYIVELENYNPITGKFNITFSKYGDIEKNIIFWKNINTEDENYKEYVLSDFTRLIADNYELKLNVIRKKRATTMATSPCLVSPTSDNPCGLSVSCVLTKLCDKTRSDSSSRPLCIS